MKYLFLLIILISLSCQGQTSPEGASKNQKQKTPLTNYYIPLEKLADSLKLLKSKAMIKVCKSKYLLSIVVDSKVIKSYPVVLGFNPIDDKCKEGDGCTPEGVFKIKAMYPNKLWSKFIWFDYPNEASRKKFKESKKNKLIPENASIGGDVGIHGVPAGADYAIDERQNWTLGCVSLKNKDINEIYKFAFVGMKVEIEK